MSSFQGPGAYEYDELPQGGDAIRFLTLHPGAGNDPLKCDLRTAPMSETEFEAVSYVWGSDERNQEIVCEGRRLAITTNLFRVLQRVRQPDAPRDIWADLICINQENLDEKGHQVAIMGQIYRHATRVLIHMGGDDHGHGPHVCSLLETITTTIDKILPMIPKTWNSFPYPKEDDPILADPRWDSLVHLFSEVWWTRGWVVREAGFAQDGIVFWGRSEFNWNTLMKVCSFLYKRAVSTLYAKGFDSKIPLAHLEVYEDRYPEYAKLFTTEVTWVESSLLGYLNLTRQLNLKDERDRIYAFLELITTESRQIHLKPNYKDHFLHVYQQFAIDDPVVSDDTALKVQGVVVDTVLYASEPLDSLTTTADIVSSIWRVIEGMEDSPYPLANRLSVVMTVLTAGTREGDLREWLKSEAAYYHAVLGNGRMLGDHELPVWLPKPGTIDLFSNTVKGYTHNRKIIVTKRGYIGLAPAIACQDDLCGIIFGCTTPSILRQTSRDGYFKYLGAAYIPGKTHWVTPNGRAIFAEILGAADSKDWLEWEVEEQDLYLC
ncbi:heterokaryon incompatibility protein-domain-containing protein [Phaeosphaeria sp. MPI-PUGE-AT-0046c]|nr:heterokaryon incompatibility protein-domain-containing protein [Phaeosphaeria sp. MPI-PUGE-AT-0046c]